MLFDIDGTLIDSDGAGGAALLSALHSEFDVQDARPVVLHGRTDRGIIAELLHHNGVAATPENVRRLCSRYFRTLPAELARRSGRVLPGVHQILREVESVDACHVGLLTGNMSVSARMKLDHFGLWDFFRFGIFGDAVAHRPELSQPALAGVREQVGRHLPARQIIIVGDTPLDVELAKAMNARCLAVCTGGVDAATLEAAGACRVLPDLSQTQEVLAWLADA